MDRPAIRVRKESHGKKVLYNLSLAGGIDHGSTVQMEFEDIAGRHALPPDGGGCYMVRALKFEGGAVSFLGGMLVPSHKYDAVIAALKTKGYAIEVR